MRELVKGQRNSRLDQSDLSECKQPARIDFGPTPPAVTSTTLKIGSFSAAKVQPRYSQNVRRTSLQVKGTS